MPIYEYGCQKCGRKTEAIQRVGERRLKICPHCAGPLKKLASAPSFQFKGSGWYVTDYGGKTAASKAASEKAESAGKSDDTSGKAESSGKGEASGKGESGTKSAEGKAEKKKEGKEKKTAKE